MALTAGGVLLAGCSGGAPGRRVESRVVTTSVPSPDRTPQVKIRNLIVLGPEPPAELAAGADAPVYGTLIARMGGPGDKLVAVASPDFAGVTDVKGGTIALPAGEGVSLNTGSGSKVVLKGLRKAVHGGAYTTLKLRFERAGEMSQRVQIVPRQGHYRTFSPAPAGTRPPA
ncbi:copper chaperone PCu(A)C [Actinomadura montaniterrae]|uniref:Copper chaperone PCu(A)C n=1 Tax=Actinomadura montaniterrae TaxID=1803903 RepID=A0A6L3VXM0_9ACTN|nr:copper chaperone PCu(A)C [Actinomadura montaniterrae]KAB2382930.1 copper chaperone PCu(A)C [Actinomadura montaniterrae]